MRVRELSGSIVNTYGCSVYGMDVLDRDGNTFTCGVHFQISLTVLIEIAMEDDFAPYVHRQQIEPFESLSAEVVFVFDPKIPEAIDLIDVTLPVTEVTVDRDDVLHR